MLIVDVFSSDDGAPNDERRALTEVVQSPHTNRVIVLDVYGGMMDIGWADRVIEPLRAACRPFVDAELPSPCVAARTLLGELQGTLDRLEVEQQRFSNVQFVAIAIEPLGVGSRVHIARLGALRVWLCGANPPRTLGREDAWPLDDEVDGFERPTIVTATVRPTHRWNVRDDGGPGFKLVDETEIAATAARAYREETLDITDPRDVSLVVMSHPFWTDIEATEMPVASTHAELAKGIKAHVDRVETWRALATVILARPI